MLGLSLFAFTDEQIEKIQVGYNVGKKIVASNGESFEKTLPSLLGQESSWEEHVIGDKYDSDNRLKSVYESSLGNYQVKLSTAKLTIRKYDHLYKKYKHMLYEGDSIYLEYESNLEKLKNQRKLTKGGIEYFQENSLKILENSEHAKKIEYYESIINNPKWIERFNRSEEKAIKTMDWAHRRLDYHKKHYDSSFAISYSNAEKEYNIAIKKLEEYEKIDNTLKVKAHKDTMLINKLLSDNKFGAEIAGHYLLSMYEEALSKGYKGFEAYWRAVGRYNGGWNNEKYYYGYYRTKTVNGKKEKYFVPGVRDRLKTVRNLIKKGVIKT